MDIHAMYWSATGTTKRVVSEIARALAGVAGYTAFDFTLPAARGHTREFTPQDIVVFGTPVYAGRVPNVLLPYLRTVRGNGAKAIPVVVYGNRNFDDALIELRDILEDCGFHTIAGAAFIGEHAFSRKLAAGRPDAADFQKARTFAAAVQDGLRQHSLRTPIPVGGCLPVRPYYTPRDRQGNPINILGVKPKTDRTQCTGCGLCAAICPMGAIDPARPEMVSGVCIKCCACEKSCPTGAKYFDDPAYLYHREELEQRYTRRAEPLIFL